MIRRLILITICALLLPAAAAAQQPTNGIYLEGRGGFSFAKTPFQQSGVDFDGEYDTGLVGQAALGYSSAGGFRLELEAGYREADASDLEFSGFNIDMGGTTTVYSVMANVLLDMVWSPGHRSISSVRPFIGIGAGAARVDLDLDLSGTDFVEDDADLAAFQGLAGVAFHIGNNLAITTTYSYFRTTKADFEDAAGNDIEAHFSSHNIMAGIRFSL